MEDSETAGKKALVKANERWHRRNTSRAVAAIVGLLSLVMFATEVADGQDLPQYGKISDIASGTKAYVIADGDYRKAILKDITKRKDVSLVEHPEDAEFFIEYKT